MLLLLEQKKKTSYQDKFKKEFLKVMVRMKPLFLGLREMYKHKICHLDISKNNITFDSYDM